MVIDILGQIVRAQDIKQITEIEEVNGINGYVVYFDVILYDTKTSIRVSRTANSTGDYTEKTPEMTLEYDFMVNLKQSIVDAMLNQEEVEFKLMGGGSEELEY